MNKNQDIVAGIRSFSGHSNWVNLRLHKTNDMKLKVSL